MQALLAGALAGLNLRVVRGKGLTFKNLGLPRTKRLALMIRGRLLHRAHADVSSFQFHGGVCHPLIVQQQFYQENSRLKLLVRVRFDIRTLPRVIRVAGVGDVVASNLQRRLLHRKGGLGEV